jgi:rsbT co-antagonist protein RsbR
MLWHNLRLHTRMLLGYGLMFALIAALAVFLIVRTDSLNKQIGNLSVQVTTEASAGARLTSQVANTQQKIDRYLQQPAADNLRNATIALQSLTAEVGSARVIASSAQQDQQLDDLASRVGTYQRDFQTLSALLDQQQATRSKLDTHLSDATNTMSDAMTLYLTTSKPVSTVLAALVRAQRHLELTILWSSRLDTEQTETLSQLALADLSQVDSNLSLERNLADTNTKDTIGRALVSTQLIRDTIAEYTANLAQSRQQRDKLLNEQGGQLKLQTDAIANTALTQLTDATSDLEQQGRQTQQLSGAALVLTLLIAAIFGGVLPRTITRPILNLVAATKRLNQGDFDVIVSTRDGSEIGQLAAAFNQTTAALGLQRQEVVRQQEALAQQNQELEQTLLDLRASTAARDQMAVTIRALSVPVVPILDQVILIPLVGEIDAERGMMLLERLLERITALRARIAILDVTGVPVVDESLVDWLLKATSSARLMGARCILVGISPEVAQALVASGANLTDLTTRADLRSAVEYAGRTVGVTIARN